MFQQVQKEASFPRRTKTVNHASTKQVLVPMSNVLKILELQFLKLRVPKYTPCTVGLISRVPTGTLGSSLRLRISALELEDYGFSMLNITPVEP